jgi:hypothetical protein
MFDGIYTYNPDALFNQRDINLEQIIADFDQVTDIFFIQPISRDQDELLQTINIKGSTSTTPN